MTVDSAMFQTTRWTLLDRASKPEGGEALDELCQRYWGPVYSFLRRLGCREADAQDLTQDFFVGFMKREGFAKAELCDELIEERCVSRPHLSGAFATSPGCSLHHSVWHGFGGLDGDRESDRLWRRIVVVRWFADRGDREQVTGGDGLESGRDQGRHSERCQTVLEGRLCLQPGSHWCRISCQSKRLNIIQVFHCDCW